MATTGQSRRFLVFTAWLLTTSIVQASAVRLETSAQSPDHSDIPLKRAPFSAWAGKHSKQNSHTADSETRDKSNQLTRDGESAKNSVSTEKIETTATDRHEEDNDSERNSLGASLKDVFAPERTAALSSWGGERNSAGYSKSVSSLSQISDADISEPQRFPDTMQLDVDNNDIDRLGDPRYDDDATDASPWSSKRSAYGDDVISKRPAFNSWGGKRSKLWDVDGFKKDTELVYTSAGDNKREAFSAWAGKRAAIPELLDEHAKRAAFSSWAGKRAGGSLHDEDVGQTSPFTAATEQRPADSTSDESYKRAAFSVWAGKRTDKTGSSNGQKRSPFNAWAGRRKRETTAFSAWAGKRDTPALQTRAAFSAWAGKRDLSSTPALQTRAAFSAWAGKRDSNPTPALQTRAAFSAWAGKRASKPNLRLDYNKRLFSAWAGKRSVAFDGWGAAQPDPETHHLHKRAAFNAWAGKRAAFSAWGGKRALFPVWRRSTLPWFLSSGKRAPFNVWAGKRAYHTAGDYVFIKRDPFSPWSGKRDVEDDLEKRAAFSAWAGKRVFGIFDGVDDLRSESPFSGWTGRGTVADDAEDADLKRAAFSAWAGKRSVELLPGKLAHNDDNIQMAVLNTVASSAEDTSADTMLDSKLDPLHVIDDSENFLEKPLPTFPRSSRSSRTLLSSPDLRQEDAALSDASGDVTEKDTLPSKRLWYGHLGFAPFSRWYRKRARLQKQTTALGKYLRRVLASTPMKRRFNSWAGKRSSPLNPEFGLEGER